MGLMLKEGMAMQRLNSPMIARLVEMGCAANRGQGIVYTVLELLQGKSVNELVTQRGPLPIAEACRVGINVLDGLRDVHNSGFIHRDIKPHNIIRVELEDGSRIYKLIDFGTATGALGPGRVGLPAFLARDEPVGPAGRRDGAARQRCDTGAAHPGLRQVFDSMDWRQQGVLSEGDVYSSLLALGIRADPDTVQAMVGKCDTDGNGNIDFEEFALMYAELVSLPFSAHSRREGNELILLEAFRALTGDAAKMTLDMLTQCFKNMQREMPPERVTELLNKYDTNGDGALEAQEFVNMFGELVALQDSLLSSGTLGYMSPEQYKDEAVTPASDIWAVGATLFKITTGQTPFTVTGGTWGKAMVGDMTTEAPSLSSFLFNAHPPFTAVVSKALKKDARERYASAQDMREALAQVLADLGPMQGKAYMTEWNRTEGGGTASASGLYTHGVAWEKAWRG
jgi:serine/threonine protein kinase